MPRSPVLPSRRKLLKLTGATLVTAACSRAVPARPLTVFAAASLQEVLDESLAILGAVSGHPPRSVYAGSASLARQIDQGAPADLFLSADLEWMDWLESRGRILSRTRRNIAGNQLVLVAPAETAGEPVDLTPGPDLAPRLLARLNGGRLAVAEPEVPAGRYGRQALTALGVWEDLSPHLAPAENVRAALALVARRAAPLGIVYATDALAEPDVAVVARFAPDLHSPIVYPGAVMTGGLVGQATRLLDHLTGLDGQALLRDHGFSPPP